MRIISRFGIGVSVAAMAVGSPAMAQARQYNISAQNAAGGVAALARQADQQILISGRDARGKMTQEVRGSYTIDQAIDKLLGGSGLTARKTRSGSWSIVPLAGATAPQRRDSSSPGALGEALPAAVVDERESQEIVVTASKREERLIDVPQSISVLSTAQLQRSGAVQFRDFADTVPGLSLSTAGAGANRIALRGVTTGSDLGPTVGTYVDEVPFGSNTDFALGGLLTFDAGLFGLDRIEVLRGPQGTLYGASTMGGLIKYVTTAPDLSRLTVEGQAGLSYTRSGGANYNVSGAVNAPLADDVAGLRVSGFYSHDGGYVDNLARGEQDVNQSNVYGARVDLLLRPTERLDLRLGGFMQNIDREGEGTTDFLFSGQPIDGIYDQRRPYGEPFQQRFRLASATLNYDADFAKLTSITSYQTNRTNFVWDLSRNYVPLLRNALGRNYSAVGAPVSVKLDKFVQEVRLASTGGGMFEWLVGGYYTHEKSENKQALAPLDLAGLPAVNDIFTYRLPSSYKELSAFGNLTVRFSDKFDITGGARFAHNEIAFRQLGGGILGRSAPLRRAKDNVVTWLANARYHFSDRATAYARFATGYRPGGPNVITIDAGTGLPNGSPTYDSDTLESYEVGFKATTADNRFSVDVAGYYIDWNNIQIIVSRGGFSARDNAPGGASVRGAELALTARPAQGLVFSGAFAYQDAKLSKAEPRLQARNGERLPNVPRYTVTLNGDYQWKTGSLGPSVGATLRFVSDRKASFDAAVSRPQFDLGDYTALDVRAGMDLDIVKAQFFIRNLLNGRGKVALLNPDYGARVAIMQPRTIGMLLTTKF